MNPQNQNLLVKDIMTKPVISVTLSHTVEEVLKEAYENNITGLPVVDGDDTVIGIISTLDLITDIAIGKGNVELWDLPDSMKVEKEVVSVHIDASVKDAIITLIKHGVGRIIVTNKSNKLCGILSRKDILRHFMEEIHN